MNEWLLGDSSCKEQGGGKRYGDCFFLCSTIYDLKEERDYIDTMLRAMGITVLRSEYANFPVEDHLDTYENCLFNILSADYVILIVHKRFGGELGKNLSITQKEYRYAKSYNKRILRLVSREAWGLRHKYKEYLKSCPQCAPSTFEGVDVRVFNLIEEIKIDCSNEDGSVKKNWLTIYSSMEEIRAAIEARLTSDSFILIDRLVRGYLECKLIRYAYHSGKAERQFSMFGYECYLDEFYAIWRTEDIYPLFITFLHYGILRLPQFDVENNLHEDGDTSRNLIDFKYYLNPRFTEAIRHFFPDIEDSRIPTEIR